jgi:magnesium-transporting ATPase (P-type)
MTNEQHNKYIAWAFLGYGGFQLLMTAFLGTMFFFMFSIPTRPGAPPPPMEFFGIFFAMMFLFQMIFTTPAFVAAYALLKRKPWARIASIIAAVMASMSMPFGTGACIYSLWFFFSDNWKTVYPENGIANPEVTGKQLYSGEAEWQKHAEKFDLNERQPASPPDWR